MAILVSVAVLITLRGVF